MHVTCHYPHHRPSDSGITQHVLLPIILICTCTIANNCCDMIVPYHSIHKSSITITIVFHSPNYEDRAHVKCSLSRSDGDSNRFLTSWRVIPRTNHTHQSSELQITILHYPGPIRKFGRHRQYPRTVSATKVSKVYQGCTLRPRHSPQPSPIQRMVARLPAG